MISVATEKMQGSLSNRKARRSAFSLTELVVSIGILVLTFSMVGQVFNLTIQSTGQATALTEVNQLLRAFEKTLRDDLAHVRPERSFLIIQGNPVNTHWTKEQRESDSDADASNGYPHTADPKRELSNGDMIAPRADVLMFLTARKGTSFVDPRISSNLQEVVYGHAELGEFKYKKAISDYEFETNRPIDDPTFPIDDGLKYASPTIAGPVPAEQWHLARRSVLLVPTLTPSGKTLVSSIASGMGDVRFLRGEFDVLGDVRIERDFLQPSDAGPWFLPAGLNFTSALARSQLDPTPPPARARQLGHYMLPGCASFKVEWALNPRSEFVAGRLEGTREMFWFDPGDPIDPLASIKRAEDALSRSKKPAERIMREQLRSLWQDDALHPDGLEYSLDVRFGTRRDMNIDFRAPGGRANIASFGAGRRGQADLNGDGRLDMVAEDIFPIALRVTVDLYDSRRNLDRPKRHVMVIPVGS